LHKFAIILAAAKRDDRIIQEEDLREAEAIITDNEQDMLKVFQSIGVVDQHNYVKEIVDTVRYCGPMTARGLWGKVMHSMTMRDFEDAVKAAVHGRVLEVTKLNGADHVQVPGAT
jgi:predicted sugar kinase